MSSSRMRNIISDLSIEDLTDTEKEDLENKYTIFE